MPTNIAEVALQLCFGHLGLAPQIWLGEPKYGFDSFMSKGWDVLLKSDDVSLGVIRDPGVRVRLKMTGAKISLSFKQELPRQPGTRFPRPIHPVDGIEHVNVA